MLHYDDSLFHAIIVAHGDPDPRMARRFSPFLPAPPSRHLAAHQPFPRRRPARRSHDVLGLVEMGGPSLAAAPAHPAGPDRGSVLARVRAGVTAAVSAVRRPYSVPRGCQAAPRCTPGCP